MEIRGYVSSDEDDYDDYDFGYSEDVFTEKKKPPTLPEIKYPELREKLHSILEESQKIELFLKAADVGDMESLQELLSQGVSVDCVDSQEWTPLIKACGSGNHEVVQFLLEHGADANKHRELLTPLMTCCTHTLVAEELKLNCVRLLLQHGANVNATDKFRTTALMFAAGSGYVDIVSEFLAAPDIEVNIQDREGWTALFHAVTSDNLTIVEKLVAAGTDLELTDRFSRTVLSLALDKNLKNIAAALGYVEVPYIPAPEMTLKERFIGELPDSNGQGGFPSDAKKFLQVFNQFNVKDISLPDLVNATDKDLYEVGVKLRPDRKKILFSGIHKYHLHQWKKSSMSQIKPGVPIRVEDVLAVTGSIAKHLTIANASLRYLDSRISSRKNEPPVDLTVQKEMIMCLINSYKSAEKLKALLTKVLTHIEQMKLEIPADYIYPFEKKKRRKMFTKKFWCVVAAAATAGFLIFFKPFNFRMISTLFTNVFQPVPFFEYLDQDLVEHYALSLDV